MTLTELQRLIETMYSAKDRERGPEGTFMWFSEEVGELAAALRENDADALAAEFADVLAWLATLANITDVNLSEAVAKKYGGGCPGCDEMICICDSAEKP